MAGQHSIKRGVSLFSFWRDYMLGQMSVEDCIALAAKLDIPGIEIVGEHMLPQYPKVPDSFFAQWQGWMAQYGRTPVAYDMYLLTKGADGGAATQDEVIAAIVRDLGFARRLGCSVMRMLRSTPPEIMEKAVPYAEQYNIKLGLEFQAPYNLEHEWIVRHREVMERVNSPYLGFVADMGIFTKRFPRLWSDRHIRDGAHEQIVNTIVARYNSHAGLDGLEDEIRAMGGNEHDRAMLNTAQQQTYWHPGRLLEIMPRIFHFHAKCYEMLPDDTEYSFPYEELIPVLIAGGYSGYLSTESEGWRFTQDAYEQDSEEQVSRHQTMLKRLLGEK